MLGSWQAEGRWAGDGALSRCGVLGDNREVECGLTDSRSAAGHVIDAASERSQQGRFLSNNPGSSNAVLAARDQSSIHSVVVALPGTRSITTFGSPRRFSVASR